MRVLLIHNYYQQFGGEDMSAERDRRLLEERGVEVQVYSRHNDEILEYGLLRKALFPLKTMWSPETVTELTSLLARFPADVAYLHNLYPLISPSVYGVLSRLGVPVVQVLHDFRPFCANGWLYTNGEICDRCTGGCHWNAVVHKCMHQSRAISAVYAATLWRLRHSGALRQVSAFVCPSEFTRRYAIKNGIEEARLFLRPHFIRVAEYRGVDLPQLQPPEARFLYLGRLSPEKGLWTLIHAFEPLGGIRLDIAGTGPLEAEIGRYLESRGLTHIRLLGFQSGAVKNELLRRARAVIVPSESLETFGITVLESYAAARAVIASNSGALPYLVEDGNTGLIFERQDALSLRAKMLELARDPAKAARMGIAGQRRASLDYGPEAAFQSLMSIFKAVIAEPAAACPRPLQFSREENALPHV